MRDDGIPGIPNKLSYIPCILYLDCDDGRTTSPNIYACGDCASPYKFTHAADWQVNRNDKAKCDLWLRLLRRYGMILVPLMHLTNSRLYAH